MQAYKFLDADGHAPYTGAAWERGVWVETTEAEPCRIGVHGCRSIHLARWLDAELWEIELADPVVESHHKVVATRGRLVARVEGYPAAVRALAIAGAWRARDRAVDALRSADLPTAPLAAASSMGELASIGGAADDGTFAGRAVALAADAAQFAEHGLPAQAPFAAACSAGHAAAGPAGGQSAFDAGYGAERAYQSGWLAERLGLN